jgi:acyl carrier protein
LQDRAKPSPVPPPLFWELVLSVPSSPPAAVSFQQTPQAQEALEADLAGLFVQALNLEMAPADIDPAAPLFGDGLGLDSIDILEVALEVSQRYGFQLRSDDDNNQKIFQSLRSLAVHVAQHRTQ